MVDPKIRCPNVADIYCVSTSNFQEASAAIAGADVFGKLKFESGIHRVQV